MCLASGFRNMSKNYPDRIAVTETLMEDGYVDRTGDLCDILEGGSVVCDENGDLQGILSHWDYGNGTEDNIFRIYTRICLHYGWIRERTREWLIELSHMKQQIAAENASNFGETIFGEPLYTKIE